MLFGLFMSAYFFLPFLSRGLISRFLYIGFVVDAMLTFSPKKKYQANSAYSKNYAYSQYDLTKTVCTLTFDGAYTDDSQQQQYRTANYSNWGYRSSNSSGQYAAAAAVGGAAALLTVVAARKRRTLRLCQHRDDGEDDIAAEKNCHDSSVNFKSLEGKA
jgi:hypothetical protein